ncbi:MAG: HD domain-containing protein [Patescibacteria group bacterium]|nr:HD domain-containing protein [Patescibacteria group bacterium]
MNKDINFIYEIGCFRFIQRTWRQFLNADFANVSEHTLRVAWIALILAKYENIKDTEKLLKMVLVHDLTESRTGDVNYLSRQYTVRKESEAIHDILEGTVLESEFLELWKEYEKKESIEAKIIKDADNLDVDFELQEQFYKGDLTKETFKDIREYVSINKLYTESAKKIWKKLQDSNPHDWHKQSNNRFNSGDWKK